MNKDNKIFKSMAFPLFIVLAMWIVEYIEVSYDLNFISYGIIPRTNAGLIGIITSPFIHANLSHLVSNSLPLFLMLWALFYFYDEIAFGIFILFFFITNILVWIFARDASHIGASGLVYATGSFLFFSGIIRRSTKLLAISLLITFMYGGMIWGIFPKFYPPDISWEAHLMGAIAGLVIATIFRKRGPQREEYEWEDEEDENNE